MYEVHQGGSKPRVECSKILKFFIKNFGSKRYDQKKKRQITVIHSTKVGLKVFWHVGSICMRRLCIHPGPDKLMCGKICHVKSKLEESPILV